jgi:hypothetical protein
MEIINVSNNKSSNNESSYKLHTNLCNDIYNSIDYIRTDNDVCDSLQDPARKFDIDKNDDEKTTDINVNIYRYKFTNEFTDELYKFAKIHQYDHRKDFKEAWEVWMEDNTDIIDIEVRRLTNLGYDGDIIDKMFKSARYYFRKKSTEKKAPAKRRIYVGVQKDLLEAMDEHIKNSINSGDFKPSDGFDEFCKQNVDILKDQVNVLCRAGLTDSNEIKAKIKKTYKNRYFQIISK